MRQAMQGALAMLLALAALAATAQDYEREKRWADEVVPGLVVGDAVWIGDAHGRKFLGLYAAAPEPKAAVVIVHGVGVHPDHGVIGVLRSKLHDLGYTTLSIQMPVLAADAKPADYPKVFPEAIERVARAAAWLRERGATKRVLVTHSMGSWMADAYFARGDSPFGAWVSLGRSGPFANALAPKRPVLDVYGENDLAAVLAGAAERRNALSKTPKTSRQVMIPGADHFYARKEEELVREIDAWLGSVVRQPNWRR